MPTGRKSEFTQAIADMICSRLAAGESLRAICDNAVMPGKVTVLKWLGQQPEFATQYARAREMQADAMDDLILDTALSCTNETAQADRVKIDAFKWRASKLAPKKYGDRLNLDHAGEVTQKVRPDFSMLSAEERRTMRQMIEKIAPR